MKYILLVFILLTFVGSAYAWDNNDRDYRKEVTVSHINGSGSDLINYPAFLNSGNLMAAELEKGYTDYALVWINISTLSISGTSFWMYYGNDICSDSWNAEGVWNSGYAMVQHLQESPANDTAGHIDSTSNNNNGTPKLFNGISTSTTDAIGKIDGADIFDGLDDYIEIADADSLDIVEELTICSWTKFASDGAVLTKDEPGVQRSYSHRIASSYFNFLAVSPEDVAGQRQSATHLTRDTWYFLTSVYNGSTSSIDIYVNGQLSNGVMWGTIPSSIKVTTTPGVIGRYYNYATGKFTGTIDELHISNVVRSSDWIEQDYEIVINQTTMITFGDKESLHKLIQGAYRFYNEMSEGLTDFRNSMGKYLVWAIIFFAVGLTFTLFAKIKQTLIGSK
jgi:hypothetical protein